MPCSDRSSSWVSKFFDSSSEMALVPAVRIWPTWAVPVIVGAPVAAVLGACLVSASRNRSPVAIPLRTAR